MHVTIETTGREVRFLLAPDSEDCQLETPGLAGDEVRAQVPDDCSCEDLHPDLLALAAVLIAFPWIGEELILSRGVSRQFAEAFERELSLRVLPIDEGLDARARLTDGSPGLAFSGGVDSTAAVAVMPPDTRLAFLERVPGKLGQYQSIYRKEAALYACAQLSHVGRTVDVVQTDLELIRNPVGFPVDVANAIPILLLADRRGIDSVGWGTIAESAYRIGSMKFSDYPKRRVCQRWNALFEAVGLPVFNAVAGVSEVGTEMIVGRAPFGSIAQSCIRGDIWKPCRRCWKCFRKSLLDSALTHRWPSDNELDNMFAGGEVIKFVNKVPLKHEDVLTFALGRYTGNHPLLLALKRKVRGGEVDMDWLQRWYTPSLDLIPEEYREQTAARLNRYLSPMSDDDMTKFRSVDLAPIINSEAYQRNTEALATLLTQHRARGGRPLPASPPKPSVKTSKAPQKSDHQRVPALTETRPDPEELERHADVREALAARIYATKTVSGAEHDDGDVSPSPAEWSKLPLPLQVPVLMRAGRFVDELDAVGLHAVPLSDGGTPEELSESTIEEIARRRHNRLARSGLVSVRASEHGGVGRQFTAYDDLPKEQKVTIRADVDQTIQLLKEAGFGLSARHRASSGTDVEGG